MVEWCAPDVRLDDLSVNRASPGFRAAARHGHSEGFMEESEPGPR